MKHIIHLPGGGSLTRDKPPVEGESLRNDAFVVMTTARIHQTANETVWRVTLSKITTRER